MTKNFIQCGLNSLKRPPWLDSLGCRLSPGQIIAIFQRNISQRCLARYVERVWPPCCNALRHVGCCWLKLNLKMVKFFTQHLWMLDDVVVVSQARFVQQFCPMACAQIPYVEPNNPCVHMLPSFGQGLQIVDQQCCVELLQSFGRGFTLQEVRLYSTHSIFLLRKWLLLNSYSSSQFIF